MAPRMMLFACMRYLKKLKANTSTALSVESCESALRLLKVGISKPTCVDDLL